MDYVRKLHTLSEFCNFGNTINDHQHDQLVFVTQDEKVQQKLLDSKDLILQTALEIAESFESAEVSVKSLHNKKYKTAN